MNHCAAGAVKGKHSVVYRRVKNASRGIHACDHDIWSWPSWTCRVYHLVLLCHLFHVYHPSFDNHGHGLVVDCSRVDIGRLKRAYPAGHEAFLAHASLSNLWVQNREVVFGVRGLQSRREDALSLKRC